MKFLKKINSFNQYISFNLFAVCGWLYLPILIWVIRFRADNCYPIFFYFPLIVFLLIPWFITTISFLIFLFESLRIKRLTNEFCLRNKYFNIFKMIGILITILFYLFFFFYNPYNYSSLSFHFVT